MNIGTYYYPEQWPREQWKRDLDHIARMGLKIVHLGEFAWFDLEPAPGDLRLDWLAECVDLAHQRRLQVILCTPTAAPPIWLAEQSPQTLPLDAHGTPGRFGGRRHYSPTAPAMHQATRRIVSALADRFGDHPAVIGWQIDNEYGSPGFDQSPATHAAFRDWLRARYATIEQLNKAWGCQFWNTYYTSFDQILMPPNRELNYANPHHQLDASRFWSRAFAQFNKLQADLLKPKVGGRFITTNFMPFAPDLDPGDTAGDLSLFAWDSYPVSGQGRNLSGETYRMGDPAAISIVHDQMASYNGRWALMELQPGQINWSGYPALPYPGAVRLWLWTAFAHGAEFVTTYRYRQPLFGTELWHQGLVGTDGVTPSPGGRQFMQVIDELEKLDLSKVPPLARDYQPKHTVGLVFDFEQLWLYQSLPQARRWDQPRWLQSWYTALTRLGLRVKVLRPGAPWPKDLPMIVAPGVQMVDEELVKQFDAYARGGGHLVLTCRTGLMDRRGQLWEGPTAKPIVPLIGGLIEAYDSLPEETFGQVQIIDGKKYPWGAWGDLLYAEPDTRVLAKYADQFYAGAAAVIQNKLEAGTVTYCGVYGEQEFVNALVEKLAAAALPGHAPVLASESKSKKAAAPAPTALPDRVQLARRGPYRILLNYQDAPFAAPAPKGARFVVGTRQVEPAGVAVWEEAGAAT